MANPPHKPTDESRRIVEGLSGIGIPHVDIARIIKIDPKTLRLHYRDEIDLGLANANAKVAGVAFKIATDINHKSCAVMNIFWLKTRLGWKETPDAGGEDSVVKVTGGLPED